MGKALGIGFFMKLPLYLLVVWALGFVLFYTGLPAPPEDLPPDTKAIVVLTGGAGRLEAGVRLLEAGDGRRLFISGVHRDVSTADLTRMAGVSPDLFDCCIDIDRSAQNTLGNAREGAAWAHSNGYDALILVTADYHMPRSLILFRRAMPDVTVTPHAVDTEAPLGFLIREYNKYLITLLRDALNH